MSSVDSVLDEEVFVMPPMSMATIEQIATALLQEIAPNSLVSPGKLRLLEVCETQLESRGVFVYPASDEELNGRAGATDPTGAPGDPISILLRSEDFDALGVGGPGENFARSTLAHELAHAILHVPRIRRIRALRLERILLSRMRRAELKPYLDPEWQAFALGGCILAPREAISLLPGTALAELARVFGTSESLMWMHLKRLRLLPKEEGYR